MIDKIDFKSPRSFYSNWCKVVVILVAILFSSFHLYTSAFGLMASMLQRNIHLMFALVLSFLLFPARKTSPLGRITLFDTLLVILSFITMIYLWINFKEIIWRTTFPLFWDKIIGLILIVMVLEMARRTIGIALPIISIIFLLYAYFGPILPSPFTHRGYDIDRIIGTIYMTTNGIFGIPLGVSATFISMFILFGSFLEHSGGGQFFIDLANALVGRTRGGPAKVAVVASGIFGSISGSAAANVATTGTFTIPMMKKLGYKDYFAGAVEAVASTGGMIMPPIMGSGAFIMAEILGISYVTVIKAAFIPALLYYIALMIMVHFEAIKQDLKGLSREECPKLRDVIITRGYLLMPLILLIYLLVIRRMSPMMSALWSSVAVILVSFLGRATKMNIEKLIKAFVGAAENMIKVASACACAGIVIGVLSLTGLGLRLSIILPIFAGNNLILLLFLTMIASIILGMGLPATAAYILLAVLGAPALVGLGASPLAAHLFVFYFGCISNITPPVCVAGFVASGISGASVNKIGMAAVKLGIVGFLVPYLFIFNSTLLLEGAFFKILYTFFTGITGCFCLAIGLQGWLFEKLSWILRIIMILAGLSFLQANLWVNLIIFIILGVFLYFQWKKIISR